MRSFTPILLVFLGLLVAFVATLLGFTNASIHPDSTLEMYVTHAAKLKKYNSVALLGLISSIGGVTWMGLRVLARRRKKKLHG